MATGKTGSVPSLYTELNRLGNSGDYERALKTANKLVSLVPDDLEALQCKIICLMQLSKFTEALQIINKSSKYAKNLVFEKAYTQYRLNQPSEALKTVNSAGALDDKLRELKAQILYRLEMYEESYHLYRDIIKNTSDDYEDEREANLAAVITNLPQEKKVPQLRETTYELTYNAACQLVNRSQYTEAEKKLKAAEKLCRETLEEDGATEEDVEAELGIVRGQLAYCYQVLGREREAQTMYNAILKSKPSDVGLVAVASNNSTALNREQNVFDSKKKMKSATAEDVEHKLSHRQRRNIAFNHCLLTVFTNQPELFKELNKKLVTNFPEMSADGLLLQAVQLFWEGKTKEAANLLRNSNTTGQDLVNMKLTAVHMLLVAGERKEACKILEAVLVDSGYKPGIIGSLVTLYMADNQRGEASKVFKNAVEWYKKNQATGDLSALWRQAADFHLRGGEPQVAAQSLEELLRLHPQDTKTLAQLVIAYSNFNPGKAQELSRKLPPCTLNNMAEVDALETSNWMMGTKVVKKAAKVDQSPKPGSGGEVLEKKKSKKKRKPLLPKNYEPGVKPDPERWLPKHERTGYRKKKDRRVKEVMKGSQGAATGASDMYDMSKMAPSKSSPAPASPAPDGPRQQQKKHQQKKKKGKR